MKLLTTSSILAIAVTLATTTIGSVTAIETASTSSTKLPVTATLVAKGEISPLVAQLQGKPMVVDIYASWCPVCKNIAPTLSQLKQQYGNKASFIVFDVSDSKKTQASMKMAKKLGLTSFFNENKSKTSTVAIIDSATGKILKQFQNNAEITEYSSVLDLAIAQCAGGDTMSHGDAMKKP
ncbi:thioredoxin domain-containing protein [Chamaesiphon sp. VAR_48_metabat_135_sub]|uniref:thioredoxin domain-containing protein n=1 Tax=Chamaesiphon sp. VAR_48_metabat_135_sub TaxID=2964699 RepID=UPI00286B9750|nr:thioredoxin domain-containing protein [Chamaesiphon sp. VAR_48_metabat_135_sub]